MTFPNDCRKLASDSLCSTLACVKPMAIASEERTSTQEYLLTTRKKT